MCCQVLFENLDIVVENNDVRRIEKVTEILQTLDLMFKTKINDCVSIQLRHFVPNTMIKVLFQNLRLEFEDSKTFQQNILKTLVSFSCLPSSDSLLFDQQKALEALLETEYDFANGTDYELVLTLLNSIKFCSPESLSENILCSIFNIFQKVCEVRYNCYLSAVKILDLFYDIYPFVAKSDSDCCKSQFVEILYPFYCKIQSYGPSVSISLLKCMSLLFELEPSSVFTKWQNEEIVLKIPKFLTSQYQEVRLCAIKCLIIFFKVSSETRLLEQYHRQEIIFSIISELSPQILQIEGNATDERIIDETVTRSSSILHTFASIMISSHLWIEEALFTLLKIVCDKNLDLDQLTIVLKMVAEKLGYQSHLKLLEKYIVGLVTRWKSLFPFKIYNCNSKIQFYAKYHQILAHIITKNDLLEVANFLGESQQNLVEKNCARLFTYCIQQEICNSVMVTDNQIYHTINSFLGVNKMKEVVKNNIEEVILYLIEFVSDDEKFKELFNERVIFPKVSDVRMTVGEFNDALQYLENTLYGESSLIENLIKNNPEKIHFLLLQFSVRMNTSLALEDKLRYFHLYSIFSGLCLDVIASTESLQVYLIRDLTYNLLHNIKNYKEQPVLSKISCKFLKIVLEKILPDLSTILRQFFFVIVSRLKNITLENSEISNLCINMLKCLIVKHKSAFKKEIQKLDSIPETEQFREIYSVHFSIKYNDQKVTLDDEITQFLDFANNIESLHDCEHSLRHLRLLLTEKKNELGDMLLKLRKTRGFSKDCEDSNLHKLICILIKLVSSKNRTVSSEAGRCLGEIGPSNLNSLILQPEKPLPLNKNTPWELTLSTILTLLSKYIVDSDVNIVKMASVALFQVLSTKEARKIAESDDGPVDCRYLTPFFAMPVRKKVQMGVNIDIFVTKMTSYNLWITENGCHKSWVRDLVCGILETFKEKDLCDSLVEVCKVKMEFCEQILPHLIHTIFTLNIPNVTNIISNQITSFFDKHWSLVTTNNQTNSTNITTNKSSVQCMLNVIHFLRLQNDYNKLKLNLDFLKIAKAAHFCTAHFTALLYSELWCQQQINQSPDSYSPLSTCSYTKLDMIYEKVDGVVGHALLSIFREAYKAVGEVDALSGCGTSHLLHPSSRIEHYKELGRWDEVSHRYDLQVDKKNLVDSLKMGNYYQLSLFCSEEADYESLWRLGQWDYNKTDLSESYDKCKFYAFKSLIDKDEFSFVEALEEGRVCVGKDFNINMESIKGFYNSFSKLQALKEMEDFTQGLENNDVISLLDKWKLQDDIISNDYVYVEPIHSQRILLLTEFVKKTQYSNDDVMDTIISYAKCARIEGQSRVAFRILENLRQLQTSSEILSKIHIEEAQLCWDIQDTITAKCILKELCNKDNPRIYAMALKILGTWMVESASENRQTIIENYFQKSINLLKETKSDEKIILDTFAQLAKFADQEYQEVMTHIKSDIFQKKKKNIVKAMEMVKSIDLLKATRDLKKAVCIKQKQSTMDEIEINNIEQDKNSLLRLALRYYLLNLIGSDDHNMSIFRLFSLLLENRTNEIVTPVLNKDIYKIPTYKFINILPQITPHISNSSDLFSETVNKLVENCAREHPHHTLPLILALALSNKDRDYTESKSAVNDARTRSAKNMLNNLKNDSKLRGLIEKMEFLSEAFIELAYLNNDGRDDEKFKIPRSSKIKKVKDYDDVLLPTYSLPVSKALDYSRIVGIRSFNDTFHNVGGINAPKRITCLGTDGVTRSQLIKGQDDLRQDAVMQQVFTIMNSLLNINKQTKNLLIRTYKIVPLSMRSGILEWVENTIPIGSYLTGDRGDGGAHAKFRPMDKTPSKCRLEFKNLSNIKSNEEKLKRFNKICENIKPVFHKFFETSFPQPTVWYEKRRAYIHSVATSSMCGYILGIGDRHVNNILIDKSTAEVVHIDFGIAFEQGKCLPTPETIPFRLSRDIVDGMGVSGVEGVFRRSCEKTVEVLRMHYQTIITILEVLLYDPLYDWTVSTAEANKRQKDEQDDSELNMSIDGGSDENASKDVNVTAERALLRLRAKLLGTESGKSSSVEHQVGTLIQQAVDPSNLSRLFHGWQPYL